MRQREKDRLYTLLGKAAREDGGMEECVTFLSDFSHFWESEEYVPAGKYQELEDTNRAIRQDLDHVNTQLDAFGNMTVEEFIQWQRSDDLITSILAQR